MPVESGGSQTTGTSSNGTDARAFASAEDSAEQSPGSRPKRRVHDESK